MDISDDTCKKTFKDIEICIQNLRDREFKIFNIEADIEPIKKILSEEDINKISFDAKKINQKVNDYKIKKTKKKSIVSNNFTVGNDLANMQFIQSDVDRKRWTELSKIEKKKALIDYIDTLNLDEELYNVILKRRILKNDVNYNIFDQKIESLNFLIIKDNKYKMKLKKKNGKKTPKIFK